MRKFFRQNVQAMPQQSLLAMKVAFGVRAQYMTIMMLSLLMITQLIGVAIFSDKVIAASSTQFVRSFPGNAIPSDLFNDAGSESTAIAEDGNGNIYLVNGQNKIYKFDSNGSYQDTVQLSTAVQAHRIAINGDGEFFVIQNKSTGSDQNQLLKFGSNGAFQNTVAVGHMNSNGALCQAGTSFLHDCLTDVKFDDDGNMYVLGTGALAKYDETGAEQDIWTTIYGRRLAVYGDIAYAVGTAASSVAKIDTGTGTVTDWGSAGTGNGQFNSTVGGVAVSPDGSIVYVIDRGSNRIQRFDTDGAYLGQWLDVEDPEGTDYGFSYTSGVSNIFVTSAGNVLVGDPGNNRLVEKTPSDEFVRQWRNEYAAPEAMALLENALFVVDSDNSRVKRINKTTGAVEWTIGGRGTGASYFNFNGRTGIGVDSSAYVYVLDSLNSRVQKFNGSDGSHVVSWGSLGSGNGQFSSATGLAVDVASNIYVIDLANRVQKFNADGTYLDKVGATGTGNGQFTSPSAITTDGNEYVYVADTVAGQPRVQVFDNNLDFVRGFNPMNGSGAVIDSMTVDGQGNILLVSDDYAGVEKVSSVGEVINAYNTGFVTSGVDIGQVTAPAGIMSDGSGTLYISDNSTNRIQTFIDTGFSLRLGTQKASSVTNNSATLHGSSNDYNDEQSASYSFEYRKDGDSYEDSVSATKNGYGPISAMVAEPSDAEHSDPLNNEPELYGARGVAIDSQGNRYVVDGVNSRVVKFNQDGDYVSDFGNDLINYPDHVYGQNGLLTPPVKSVAVDTDDNVYVVAANQVVKFTSEGSHMTEWGTTGSGSGEFNAPNGILVDDSGNVFVADSGNSRIQKFDTEGAYITEWETEGAGEFEVGGSSAYYPLSLAMDSQGVLYVGFKNTYVIQKYSYDGDYLGAFGEGGTDEGQIWLDESSDMSGVFAMAFDSNNVLHVADGASGQYVYMFNQQGQYLGLVFDNDIFVGYAMAFDDQDVLAMVGNDPARNYAFNRLSGTLSGLECGTAYFYRTTTNHNGNTVTGNERQFTTEACGDPVAIVTTSLPDAYTGQEYSATIETENSTGELTFSIIDGTLPDNLILNPATGEISGIPAPEVSGTDNEFTVQVTDDNGDDTQVLNLTIHSVSLIQICDDDDEVSLPINQAYTRTICTVDGFGYPAFEIAEGSLPPGLTLDPIEGTISGTPTAAGDYSARIEVSDLSGSDSQWFYYDVKPQPAPRVNTPIVTITSPNNGASFSYQNDDVTVTGAGPANKTITLFMDGQQLGTTVANGSGAWQYTVNNVFPGSHSFDAKWIPSKEVAFVGRWIGFFGGEDDEIATNIGMVDLANNARIKDLLLPSNYLASSIVLNHAGSKVYSTGGDIDTDEASLITVDVSTGTIANTVEYGSGAVLGGMTITPDDQYAYMAVYGEEDYGVVKIRLSDGQPVSSRIDISDITNVPDGMFNTKTFGTSFGAGILYNNKLYTPPIQLGEGQPVVVPIIDLSDNSVGYMQLTEDQPWVGSANGMTSVGNNLYVALNDTLYQIDMNTSTITKDITIPAIIEEEGTYLALAVDDQQAKAYVSNDRDIYIVDLAAETAQSISVFPDTETSGSLYMVSLRLSDDQQQLYVTNYVGGMQVLDVDGIEDYEFPYTAEDIENMTEQELLDFYMAIMPTPVGVSASSLSGRFIGAIQPVRASIGFSVGAAPVTPTNPTTPTTPTNPTNPEEPTVIDVTPPATEAPRVAQPSTEPYNAPQRILQNQNNLLALVRRIPEPIAIGFPWLLLILALILVSIQYYQVRSESIATRRMLLSLAKQQQLSEEQDNFVALSTHYLHTPLTVMEGEISLMVKAGTLTQEQATKLKATLAGLNAAADDVLAAEESNKS